MGNEVADASVWQARAAAWELAALSLRYPSAELAGVAAGGEWDEAAGEIHAALGLPRKVPRRRAIPQALPRRPRGRPPPGPAGADALLRPCDRATRLFVRAPEPAFSHLRGACGPQSPTGCSRFCS